jgi:hypothetical protein
MVKDSGQECALLPLAALFCLRIAHAMPSSANLEHGTPKSPRAKHEHLLADAVGAKLLEEQVSTKDAPGQ